MTRDLVLITETRHLRIEPRDAGVCFVSMLHDESGLEAERAFPDAAAAQGHAAEVYGVDADAWVEVGFPAGTRVRIADTDPDADVRGRTGEAVGLTTPDSVAVMIDGLDRVWCVHPEHLVELEVG